MPIQTKKIRPLSLSAENIEWITRQAAKTTQDNGKYISASRIVDDILTAAREAEAKRKTVTFSTRKGR